MEEKEKEAFRILFMKMDKLIETTFYGLALANLSLLAIFIAISFF